MYITNSEKQKSSEDCPSILNSEVEKAVSELKNKKAPGTDQIKNELIKLGKQPLLPILTQIFNDILKNAEIPDQWKISKIILLHKKGNINDINNYRLISLISSLYKIFASILNKRISGQLCKALSVEQAGFRKGFSTS